MGLSMRISSSELGGTSGKGVSSQSGSGIPGGLTRGGVLDSTFCIRSHRVNDVVSWSVSGFGVAKTSLSAVIIYK